MSSALRSAWNTVVGLVIEDSQLAIGIVATLLVTWLLATLGDNIEDVIGWILLALLVVVLLLNLVVTARRAKRRVA